MSEKTELEIAKQTLKNSKDPAEREKVQQKYDALLEKDIASDKEVIAACSNGNAGSSVKRRTKNAKAFHDKCENFSFRASNETDVLITAFYSLHGDHLGYG
ncbi:hypothetical protein LN311_004689 [Escherichia coli]|nr:hypothetical protein [Escherichia coli]